MSAPSPPFPPPRSREWLPGPRVTVWRDGVPADLLAELPGLYGSCFSVPAFFATHPCPGTSHCLVIDEPRQVVVVTVHGATAEVRNRRAPIDPASVRRLVAATLRAFPRVVRVRLEVLFPPEALGVPGLWHVTAQSDDFVITLPDSVEAYRAALGRRTRQNLNQYQNRLARRCPGFRLETLTGAGIGDDVLRQAAAWNASRLRARGVVPTYERHPGNLVRLRRLLDAHGVALCGSDGERRLAAQLAVRVGDDLWVHLAGFDPDFEDVRLGFLMTYFTATWAIAAGCRRLHLLYGTPVYKQRLGARPQRAWQVSVYRHPLFRRLYAGERLRGLDAGRVYWQARRRVREALEGVPLTARLLAAGRTAMSRRGTRIAPAPPAAAAADRPRGETR